MVILNNRFTAILATAGALSSSMSMPSLVEAAAVQTRQEAGGLASAASSSDIAALDQPPSSKGRQQILALPAAIMSHSASVASLASNTTPVEQKRHPKDQKEEKRDLGFDSTNPMTRLAMKILGSRSLRVPADALSAIHPLLSLHAKKAIAPANNQTSSSSPLPLAPPVAPVPAPASPAPASPAPASPAPPAAAPAPPTSAAPPPAAPASPQNATAADASQQAPTTPSPPGEHYIDAAHNADVSKQGTDNEVTFERRHHHHHHHVHYDKIIVKGNNDKVRVHGADAKHTKIVVKGDNDRVHLENRHHHGGNSNKVIVKGDHDSVKIHDGHHHHHSHNKVVVKGDHDRVKIDKRRSGRFRPHPRAWEPSETDVEARSPRHHHDHHDHHEHHGKTLVIKGDGKTVDVRRREDMTGAPGRVDITSNNVDTPAGIRVASLCLSDDFVLNACDTNSTTIYLAPAPDVASAAATDTPVNHVLLQLPVYEPTEAAVVPFCATFDPNPTAPEPLTAERCFNGTTAIQDHKSQTFEYDDTTGVIRPMWLGDQAGTVAGGANNTTVAQTAPEDPPTPAEAGVASVTDIGSAAPIVRRQAASGAQNVTLVFVPDAPVAAKAVGYPSLSSSLASTMSASSAPTSTPAAPSAVMTATASMGAQAQASGSAVASASASMPPIPSASGSAAASASLGAQAEASGTAPPAPTSSPASMPNEAGSLNVEIGPMAAVAPVSPPVGAPAPSAPSPPSNAPNAPSPPSNAPNAPSPPANAPNPPSPPSSAPVAPSAPSATPMAEAKDSSGALPIDADAIASKIAADRRAFYDSNVLVQAANITSAVVSSTPSPSSIIASAKATASAAQPGVNPGVNGTAAAAAEARKMTPMSTEPYRWVFSREE